MATTDETHKTCVRCQRLGRASSHPLSAFPANPKTKDQKSSWCQPCHTEYRRVWLAKKSADALERWKQEQRVKRRRDEHAVAA